MTFRHFFLALIFFSATCAYAVDWRLSTPHETPTPDTIGVGYNEQLGERAGEFGAKKRLIALSGIINLALQTEVLDRSVSGFQPHFKEDIKFKADYRQQTTSPFLFGWVMDGESYRDRQSSQMVQLGTAGALANGFSLLPEAGFSSGSELVQRRGRALIGELYQGTAGVFGVHGGFAYDEDLRNVGRGPAMQMEVHSDSLALADWEMSGDAAYRHAWLNPRQDGNGSANVALFRRYDEATVTVNAAVDHALRDIVSTPLFRRDEWHGNGSAQIKFPAPLSGNWNFDGEWDGSKVNQGNVLPSSSQFRQEYQLQWSGIRSDRFLMAGYRVGFQTSRSGQQLQKDHSESVSLNTGLTSGYSDSLQLSIDGTATRTDTPDTLDYNDRDETRWHIGVTSTYRLRPGLWLGADGSAVLLHNKYLSKYTSSGNRNTNTFTIGGTMTQEFRGGSHHFRAEAVVTYVLFDFELSSQPNRDVLSRRLTFFDSASAGMGPGALQWGIRADFEDRGAFNRSAYEQSLSESIQTTVGNLRYRIPVYGVGVGVGVAAYERQPYHYEIKGNGNVRYADISTAGLGPVVTLDRSPGNGWRLYGEATMLVVSRSPQGSYMQNNVSLILSRLW